MLTKNVGAIVLALAGTAAYAQDPAADTAPAPASDAAAPAGDVTPAAPADAIATVPVEGAAPAEATAAVPAPASKNRLVEEIVVTAQKREENIQDVPIAITAFSPAKLEAAGVETVEDLPKATPGLTITVAAAYNVAYLRGVGTDAFLAGADPSVPFYLDGVALLGTQGSADTLGRVERVEVLKGPQGTLFGRNATGGAISIITPEPGSQFAGDVKISYGNFDDKNIVGYTSIPIADGLAFSISGFYDQYRNYYKNDYNNGDGPIISPHAKGFRAKIRWDVNDDWYITPTYAYNEAATNAGLSFELTRVAPIFCPLNSCTIPGNPALVQDPKRDRHVNFDQLSGAQVVTRLEALTSVYKTSWLDFKVIGSHQTLDAPFVQDDFDAGPNPLVSFTSIKQLAKQDTAEVQFISNKETPFSDKLQWVGGIYYIHASGGFDPLKFTVAPNFLNTLAFQNPTLPLGVLSTLGDGIGGLLSSLGLNPNVDAAALNSYGISDAHSWAGYFQGTYYFTDWLNMTAGARYQKERRDLVDGHLKVVLPNGDEVTERTDSPPTLHATQVSPKVNVQVKPTEDSQVYLSWSRAYKSPTYNTVNFFSTPKAVKEEKVDSYEIGYKGDPFDNLRINAAAFLINQKDLLTGFVALASGGVVEYDNAGNARIKGAEGDFTWSPLPTFDPGLALTGAVTYLHAYYTKYTDGRGFDEATGLAFGQGSLTGLPARDFTGNTIVRTPKWSYSLAANQRWEFGPGGIEVGADMYFSSRFYFLPQDAKIYSREAYHTYNARLTYFLKEPSVEFTAFVQNIGDVEYNEVVFTADFGRNEVLNAPRLYGFRMSMKF